MEEEQLTKIALYGKVKFVEGENFVTIEDTKHLSDQEMLKLIDYLVDEPYINHFQNVTILASDKFNTEVSTHLADCGFELHDENVTVQKRLVDELELDEPTFTLRNIKEIPLSMFKDIWGESMSGSLNAPSLLSMDEQMRSVKKELGPSYEDSCIVAFENENPIGVVMPHIEPGTTDEGRLFFFGLLPAQRGKGKSKSLHRQALGLLKDYFNAAYYIGSTGYKNVPMLKTFESNGCTILEQNKVYKRKK
ncbi:GNAT family N-acetyltransferase [Virgibacillus flavescens]|uniref:GNAT family N-acetyltransferase n=1 Tax=Virgibacillus flavescens TaxID=1611422 RepID=UPI003D32C655